MSPRAAMAGAGRGLRWRLLARHAGLLAAMNLVWEFAQMPLYTIWTTGSAGEIVYAGLHCTAGDVLIGAAALLGALLLAGPARWPREGRGRVLVVAVSLGLAYTVFSEWLNIDVRGAWDYSERMPVIPLLGTGLTPFLQWLTLPVAAYLWAIRFALMEQDDRPQASRADRAPGAGSVPRGRGATDRPPDNSPETRSGPGLTGVCLKPVCVAIQRWRRPTSKEKARW